MDNKPVKNSKSHSIVRVAQEAGVSTMTVSRFFNHPEKLTEATRKRVEAAIKALHYVPNAAARSLIRGNSNTLALVVVDLNNPFFTTLARGVEDVAHAHGYTLIIGNTDETVQKERDYVHTVIARRVDGVILTPTLGSHVSLERLKHHNIPAVLVDRTIAGSLCDTVRGDAVRGGYLLTSHLISQGFCRIAFVGGPKHISSLQHRLAGYGQAVTEAGLEPSVHLGAYTQASGAQITQALFTSGKAAPEALVAANNFVALGALLQLRQLGLEVPVDVALAAFDDFEVAALIAPFLTAVSQPSYQLGRSAADMLLERINGYDGPPREQVLPVTLMVRRSSLNG